MNTLNNYYLHATGGFLGTRNNELSILKILEVGKIKSPKYTNKLKGGFNNDNEICLCDTKKELIRDNNKKLISSYDTFVKCGPTLVLERNLNVIEPNYKYFPYNEGETDLYDEVRCTNNISLDKLKYITLPIPTFKEALNYKYYNPYIHKKIKRDILNELYDYEIIFNEINNNYKNIKIKNIYTDEEIKKEHIEKLIYQLKKTFY